MTPVFKKGYITVHGIAHHEEVAWREEDGSPVFFDTPEEAQQECELDWAERNSPENGLVPNSEEEKDSVAYCIQQSDTIFAVYDLGDEDHRHPLFFHNTIKP